MLKTAFPPLRVTVPSVADPFLKVTVPLGVPAPCDAGGERCRKRDRLSSDGLRVAGCQLDGRAAGVVEDHVAARCRFPCSHIRRAVTVEVCDRETPWLATAGIVVDRSRKGAGTTPGEKEELVVLVVGDEDTLIPVSRQADGRDRGYRSSGGIVHRTLECAAPIVQKH